MTSDGIDLPSGTNASQWYSLMKQVLSDLRGNAFKSKKSKLERYEQLFNATRRAHVDYTWMFQKLIDECRFAGDIALAKASFLKERKDHKFDRTLAKWDANTYLDLTEDLPEKRFLTSVIWYFHYQDHKGMQLDSLWKTDLELGVALEHTGDRAWDSASSLLWYEIEDEVDKGKIAEIATEAIAQINGRFSSVVNRYTELEGVWKFGNAPIPSRLQIS